MREAARALDDVSDHLGQVLRHADELLAEWSRFGAQVRTQVDHEVAAIGEVVDGAVVRAAGAGIDRAITDRLRALTTEIDRLEQRTRAASRAVVEHREADRRVLWVVVAGIVLANALLVALLLRRPEPAPVAEPVRMELAPAPSAAREPAASAQAGSAAGSAEPLGAGTGSASATAPTPVADVIAPVAGEPSGPAAGVGPSAKPGGSPAGSIGKPGAKQAPESGAAGGSGAMKPGTSGVGLPPKAGAARVHRKW